MLLPQPIPFSPAVACAWLTLFLFAVGGVGGLRLLAVDLEGLRPGRNQDNRKHSNEENSFHFHVGHSLTIRE